jgi:phospholipid/cholesterol/gamma-HCH transport system substrate-binding protein
MTKGKHPAFTIRVGFFVLCGVMLLTAGIFYIGKQKNMFSPVIRVNASFKNISGLEVGNNVRFLGINVGTVDDISIANDSTAMVHMIIKKDLHKFIKKDSRVRISSEGIIGDKIVNIGQGSPGAAQAAEDELLPSAEPVDPDQIMVHLKETGENATVVSEQLAEILYNINNGKGTVGRLIRDTSIADNLDQIVIHLKKSARGLEENMQAAKHNIFLRNYFKKKSKSK